jgi:SAM-dependent methyltransferase
MTTGDPSQAFGSVAAAYADLRPDYPAALFDFLVSRLEGRRSLCVDLGAGPGKASLDLAARFERVIAVEPDARMLDLMPVHPGIERRNEAAEAANFEDRSVDCVTAATSFHWMDQETVCAHVARWLRPGGVFFPFLYGPFYVVGPALPVFERHWAKWAPFMDRRLGAKADYSRAMKASGAFSRFETFAAPIERTMTPDDAAGLFLTTSYARAYAAHHGLSEDYREALSNELSTHGEVVVGFPLGGVLGVRSD